MQSSAKSANSAPMLFSNHDLKKLLIPLLLEQLLNIAIGMVDTIMVASCGEASVSGVSLVDNINILLINVFSALATGGAVVAAQYLGKRDAKGAASAAKQLFYVVLTVSVTIMGICLVFCRSLLSGIFGSVEKPVMDAAVIYFIITAISYPFLAMYNASAALLRSMGNTQAALRTSIIMNAVNAAGNALLIYGLHMDTAGAAAATLFSRIIGMLVMQRALRNPENPIPCPRLRQLESDGPMVRRILQIGVPNGLENSLFQLGKLLLLSLVATFGTPSVAANAVANSVCSFQVLPGSSVSLALLTVVGQCVGAGQYEQARYYTRRLLKFAYLTMGSLNVLMLLTSQWLIIPYNLSAEAAGLCLNVIRLHGVGCLWLWLLSFCLPATLRAAGDTVYVMKVAISSMLMFRIVFGYLLARNLGMGLIGVWLAMQIDWVFRSTLFIIRYRGKRWYTKALV